MSQNKDQREPIVLQYDKPVKFPKICLKCGVKTKQRIHINPIVENPGASLVPIVAGLFIPFIGVLHAAQKSSQTLPIPVCFKCQLYNLRPSKWGLIFLILFIVNVISVFALMQALLAGPAILAMFCLPVTCMLMMILWSFKRPDPIPIDFYIRNKKFHYVIHGGPIYDLYLSGKLKFK